MSCIEYIGVDDTDIDLFESQYEVPEGMCYNSYLIKDEKIAIMDTVDHRKSAEWMQNLKKKRWQAERLTMSSYNTWSRIIVVRWLNFSKNILV